MIQYKPLIRLIPEFEDKNNKPETNHNITRYEIKSTDK